MWCCFSSFWSSPFSLSTLGALFPWNDGVISPYSAHVEISQFSALCSLNTTAVMFCTGPILGCLAGTSREGWGAQTRGGSRSWVLEGLRHSGWPGQDLGLQGREEQRWAGCGSQGLWLVFLEVTEVTHVHCQYSVNNCPYSPSCSFSNTKRV